MHWQETIRRKPERALDNRPVFTQVETELAVPHGRDRQPTLSEKLSWEMAWRQSHHMTLTCPGRALR